MLSKEEIADYKKAGAILKEVFAYGKTLVKPGANILEVCKKLEEKTYALGGKPAFPAQPSINNIAAHWCPEPDSTDVFEKDTLVKLDCGVHVNGRIADAAISIDLSEDQRYKALIEAAQAARDAAIEIMVPGTKIGEIGRVIQEEITKRGFSPIMNLSGHGLGDYDVHTWPSVPNFDTKDETVLEEGMVLAVEPFATTGTGKIFEQEAGNIYSLLSKPRVRSQYARSALKIIETYEGLPFCMHWLAEKMGVGPAKFAMRELIQTEAVQVHPPLPEVSGAIVSQAEHSVIVANPPIVYTR